LRESSSLGKGEGNQVERLSERTAGGETYLSTNRPRALGPRTRVQELSGDKREWKGSSREGDIRSGCPNVPRAEQSPRLRKKSICTPDGRPAVKAGLGKSHRRLRRRRAERQRGETS